MSKNAAYYIDVLGLTPHIEGGFFVRNYQSQGLIPAQVLPPAFQGDRHYSSAIYFLLEFGQFSAFHKIASDELWHFYAGERLMIYELDAEGNLLTQVLGNDLAAGEVFQAVVRAGHWFASRCEVPNAFSLVGCTVAPGFDYADFQLAEQRTLLQEYPQHADLIKQLCRK